MSIADRAKQFMPFAALRGFGAVIREREAVKAEKPTLSEEETEKLNETVSSLVKGDLIRIKYYEDGFIKEIVGAFTEINTSFRFLRIVKTKIEFDDVISAEKVSDQD